MPNVQAKLLFNPSKQASDGHLDLPKCESPTLHALLARPMWVLFTFAANRRVVRDSAK